MKKLSLLLLSTTLLTLLLFASSLSSISAGAAPLQAGTPAPTPTPPYPPSIDIPGSTLPLVWGAFILVFMIIVIVLLAQRARKS